MMTTIHANKWDTTHNELELCCLCGRTWINQNCLLKEFVNEVENIILRIICFAKETRTSVVLCFLIWRTNCLIKPHAIQSVSVVIKCWRITSEPSSLTVERRLKNSEAFYWMLRSEWDLRNRKKTFRVFILTLWNLIESGRIKVYERNDTKISRTPTCETLSHSKLNLNNNDFSRGFGFINKP